jgi:hypothetical protein
MFNVFRPGSTLARVRTPEYTASAVRPSRDPPRRDRTGSRHPWAPSSMVMVGFGRVV